MVIIRVKAIMSSQDVNKVIQSIHAQAALGVIVLPNYCELLNEVPDDTDVEVVALQNSASDCDDCGRKDCEYFRSAVRRINCPLWRAKG